MTIEMRMPYSSNATFLVSITDQEETVKAIYKPMRGEKPLWDFEPGLHRREVAAYRLAEATRMPVVPPTIGSPEQLLKVPEEGVPRAGVVRDGEVCNTTDPVPVVAASLAAVIEPSAGTAPPVAERT